MSDFSKVRHDFVNNALRLEVLNKLIVEKLEQDETPEEEYLQDLTEFLVLHNKLLAELKTHF